MENKEVKKQKTLLGLVSRLPKDKTLVVRVERKFRHPRYGKIVKNHKKYLAHFESDIEINVGDEIEIGETRPISKRKNWEFIRVVNKVK